MRYPPRRRSAPAVERLLVLDRSCPSFFGHGILDLEAVMKKSLYERLGGREGIARIANEAVDAHMRNPLIAPRFQGSDAHALKESATLFFCAGSGGPECYEGKDMRAVHLGMNISEQEYMAVMDDMLGALKKCRIGPEEQNEVLSILYSLKGEILRV